MDELEEVDDDEEEEDEDDDDEVLGVVSFAGGSLRDGGIPVPFRGAGDFKTTFTVSLSSFPSESSVSAVADLFVLLGVFVALVLLLEVGECVPPL